MAPIDQPHPTSPKDRQNRGIQDRVLERLCVPFCSALAGLEVLAAELVSEPGDRVLDSHAYRLPHHDRLA
jgi:hypothetical protein